MKTILITGGCGFIGHHFVEHIINNTDFYYAVGKRCLSNYYGRYGPTFDQMVEDTDVGLTFSIGEHTFRGIIDRLDHPKPGKWIVHDYKTSKRSKTERQAMNDIQLALY